jgi:small subunit ribosomal protein S9
MAEVVNTSGKRKEAVARCTVTVGTGKVRINNVPLEIVTPELVRLKIMEPMTLAGDKASKVDVSVNVAGGGFMGQAEATRTAIAKGLVDYLKDAELETMFKTYDRTLLVSDPRRKLPKKPLGRGARKKRQKSYR